MIRRILLTGATGFIGSHVLHGLLERYEVIITKRTDSDTWRIASDLSRCTAYDIDKTPLSDIFSREKIDCVIHLATAYRKAHEEHDIEDMIASTITFPSKILEQMRIHDIRHFINTGTFFEYLNGKGDITEETRIAPFNLYASYKQGFFSILRFYTSRYNIKAIDLKLFSPYGPKDNPKLISYAIQNLIKGEPLTFTKGEQVLSWTYVKDIVSAYLASVESIEEMTSDLETLNIGSDNGMNLREIIGYLHQISGSRSTIAFTEDYPPHEILYSRCNSAKARAFLGWIPTYGIKDGLKETFAYYKEEHDGIRS